MICPDCGGTMVKALVDHVGGLFVAWLCNCEYLTERLKPLEE